MLPMMTAMVAMKMIRKRISFSVKRALIPSNFLIILAAIFFSNFRRMKTMTAATRMLRPRLPQVEIVGWSFKNLLMASMCRLLSYAPPRASSPRLLRKCFRISASWKIRFSSSVSGTKGGTAVGLSSSSRATNTA